MQSTSRQLTSRALAQYPPGQRENHHRSGSLSKRFYIRGENENPVKCCGHRIGIFRRRMVSARDQRAAGKLYDRANQVGRLWRNRLCGRSDRLNLGQSEKENGLIPGTALGQRASVTNYRGAGRRRPIHRHPYAVGMDTPRGNSSRGPRLRCRLNLPTESAPLSDCRRNFRLAR